MAGSGPPAALPAHRTQLVVHGDSTEVTSVPRCSWPLRIEGPASGSEAGLIRCYLQAVADRSLDDLGPLVAVDRKVPVTLGVRDLAHAPDALSGTASATFVTNGSDPFDAGVSIRFADGARERLGMDARNPMLAASRSWRLDIGHPQPDPSAPEPSRRSPATP